MGLKQINTYLTTLSYITSKHVSELQIFSKILNLCEKKQKFISQHLNTIEKTSRAQYKKPFVEADFEIKIKDFTKSKYALAVSSCTAGLHLSCLASNFKKGDEVIVPAMTHTATAHAVEYTGAKAIFSDTVP